MSWQEDRAKAPNFRKTDVTRKRWDEIVIGEDIPTKSFTLTREAIKQLAEASEDMNPMYLDEVAAKKSQFGGIISPPGIHGLLLFECTHEEDDIRMTGVVNLGQKWLYNVPARPGDTITLKRTLNDKYIKANRLWVHHENVFFNQHGEVICAGGGWRIHEK
jgi:acyl dehydratase